MLDRERRKLVLPFLAPCLILYIAFFIYPALRGLFTSLFDWSGFNLPATFIGLKNFQQLAGDDGYIQAFTNSLILMVIGGLLVFTLAFLFTIVLTSGIKGKKFFRAVIFLPNVIAPIALTTLWGFIYNPRFGLINGLLSAAGLNQLTQTWTAPDKVFGAIVVALVWIYTGFFLVLLMAGVDRIPSDIYDSAKVDGATPAQTFFRVTLPLLQDVLSVSVVLWIVTALKQFEFIYAFSGLSVRPNTYTLPIYIVVMGFGRRDPIYRLGYASAIGVTLLLLVVVCAFIARRVLRHEFLQY